jgi:diguanylate cyclase (GGDEF)-like protein
MTATDQAVSAVSSFYLEAMADQRAKTITNLINNNFDHMEKALTVIDDDNIGNQEDLRKMIGEIKSLLSLQRFALVDTDNIVYTQYTTYTGGSRYDFLKSDELSGRVISTVSMYGSSRQLCLAIPVNGLTIMGKPFKACFVQIDISEIADLLAFEDQSRTYYGLYVQNGGNLTENDLDLVTSEENLLEGTKGYLSQETWEKFSEDFAEGREGSVTLESNGTLEEMRYVPVPYTGWMLVVLIRESVIDEHIRGISDNNRNVSYVLIGTTLGCMVAFAVVLLVQIGITSRVKLEAERETSRLFKSMANIDSMTGVRNKHAYSEYENMIDHRIREEGIKEKIAVLVCDINGLKHVNDTKGHAAGDQLIKDASDLLCEYFNHGAVFRVGGDEFTVILQDKGYETMTETLAEINRVIEENIVKEGVVISIGYSEVQEDDQELHNAFERADKMMYERKKELKEMGAKTRES